MSEALQALQDIFNGRQHDRLLRLTFPDNDGPAVQLLVNRLDADEGLSRPFEYTVELIADTPDIALKDLQGKLMCVQLVRKDGTMRYFTGIVYSFRLKTVDGGFSYYEAKLGPWTDYLTLRRDNYLFHYTTMYDQTASIFADYGVLAKWDWRVTGADDVMTDCCQFDETDSNFLHRRWAAFGILYWYEHTAQGHTLVLSDDSTAVAPIDGNPEVWFQRHGGATVEDGIGEWTPSRRIVQGSVALSAYDFKSPRPVNTSLPTLNQQGDVVNVESYEYTGALGFKNGGDALARLRMEEIEAQGKHFEGGGNSRALMPGRWFRLSEHFDLGSEQSKEFLVTDVRHSASNNFQVKESAESHYENAFTCIRKIVPWRPGRDRNSVETKIHGIQTATVVGPAGEEIHTDEYGRVRVQFHWDRAGANDEKSSAWLRVATPWAGDNFGWTSIPRIGSEVLVQFLDGNPNRPIITGMVPNANTMPPWALPANKTQSGILTRSTPGGGYSNANALRFEDKKGAEQLWLHAEKDQLTEVEHDEDKWVGNDRRKTIDRDETTHVKRDRTETVDRNETITVHNNRTERVDHDEKISIGDNRTEDVGKNETISIGANRTKTVGRNEKDRIGKNWSINVANFKTETIGMAYMQNVGMGRMENVGLGYNLNVGLTMLTITGVNKLTKVGMDYSITAGSSYTVEAGGGGGSVLRMDGESITLTIGKSTIHMKKSGEIEISGEKLTIAGTDNISLVSPNIHNN